MTTIRQPRPAQRGREWRMMLGIVLLLAAVTAAIWLGAHRYFAAGEIRRAEARLSLYRSTVLAEVERFQHLTQVLAVDTFVQAALQGAPTPELNARLSDFAAAAGLDAIFLMRPDGRTIAASNAAQPDSFIGETYGYRPYFQQALAGGRGSFYGIGATTGLPGYFIADPVRSAGGGVIGVVALKISLAPFEQSWRAAGEQVFLTDEQGVVLLASDPAWRYRTLDALSADARARIGQTRQFTGQPLTPLDWQALGQRARIESAEWLHLVSHDLPHGWRLHYLASDSPAVTRAWLAAGAVVVLAALALLVAQHQRGRRLGDALRRSEQEEAGLRRANRLLAREIEDRRRAERRLEKTREELGRASRLAALGQLAASVTHELGQPIAAMRNHLAAHEIAGQGEDGRLIGVIGGLVDRMEGITRQLKFFARSDREAFEDFDLRDSIAAVIDLMMPTLEAGDVWLEYDRPVQPVIARGSRLRLEQVLTNLMRNALDAMAGDDESCLRLRVGQGDDEIWVEVADTGHGLGDTDLSQLCEPFVTTRESGQGMGLGLAISSGILKDHGGSLQARNRDAGGAVFRMILPLSAAQKVAAQ